MKLKAVKIKITANYKELRQLSILLGSDEITNNGFVIAKCDIECNILEIRKHIQEIFNCSYGVIFCTYVC